MRVVVQRVSEGRVSVDGVTVGEIGRGLLALIGMTHGDGPSAARFLAGKIMRMRVFEDEAGKMNRSVADIGGGILAVPQFTLYADASRGNRPGFEAAMDPAPARELYDSFVGFLSEEAGALHVATGVFGADMKVSLVNDGPVTILLER